MKSRLLGALSASILVLMSAGCADLKTISRAETISFEKAGGHTCIRYLTDSLNPNASSKTCRVQASYYAAPTVGEMSDWATAVGNNYIEYVDYLTVWRDAASVSILGIAAYAGYGSFNDFSATKLSGIALTGVSVNQLANYASPNTVRAFMLQAARQNFCIVGVASSYGVRGATSKDKSYFVVANGFTEVRTLLRENIKREIPDYSTVATGFSDAVKKSEETPSQNSTENVSTEPQAIANAINVEKNEQSQTIAQINQVQAMATAATTQESAAQSTGDTQAANQAKATQDAAATKLAELQKALEVSQSKIKSLEKSLAEANQRAASTASTKSVDLEKLDKDVKGCLLTS